MREVIDILNLTDKPKPTIDELIPHRLLWPFRHPMYIEFWEPKEFDNYFEVPKKLINPITHKYGEIRGLHYFKDGKHMMAMKYAGLHTLQRIVRHELTHCIHYELFGIFYNKSRRFFKRSLDPFEIHAYIMERLIK